MKKPHLPDARAISPDWYEGLSILAHERSLDGDQPIRCGYLTAGGEKPVTGKKDNPGPARRRPDETENDQGFQPDRANRLPPISRGEGFDFRGLSADFRVDILDRVDEVIVVAELPGAEEDAINLRLLNPQTLRITARRAGPAGEGYYIQERGGGTLSRLVRLPASVTGEASRTRFKNGVLEVRLKKITISGPGSGEKEIPIE